MADFAVAMLLQVIFEEGTIGTAFLLNKDRGKSFGPNDCYYGVCDNEYNN